MIFRAVVLIVSIAAVFVGCAPKTGTPEADLSLEQGRSVQTASLNGEYVFMTSTGDGLPAETKQLSSMIAKEIALATACPEKGVQVEVPSPKYPWQIDHYDYECRMGEGKSVRGNGKISVRNVSPHVFVLDIQPNQQYHVKGLTDAEVTSYVIHPKPARIAKVYFVENFKDDKQIISEIEAQER